MKPGIIENLIKHRIIDNPFDYHSLDKDLVKNYKFFDDRFDLLFNDKVAQYKLKNCHFYIKNDVRINAFARSVKGYNIIGITHGYAVGMLNIFDKQNFFNIYSLALKNEPDISNSLIYLLEKNEFDFYEYLLNCSIQFTFSHEFQHILQLNSSKIAHQYDFSENLVLSEFDLKKHAWEFDADRFGAFDLLKYIFQVKNELDKKNDSIFKALLFTGLGSIVLTKLLFYLDAFSNNKISKQEFYTRKYSHPHPIVRVFNIIEFFHSNIKSLFPDLEISIQELLNNSFEIVNIYLKTIYPKQTVISDLFKDLDKYLDDINNYNNELYEYAISDNSIKGLLIKRNIIFGK